ncbi:unnamed protein product [Owenia fusiformis]|uniref:Uncharacterized protein n=1 Tax=Owenia fusiformis TaxID=6347 RepID=A0A8J1TUR0_OWEFU|nr:unnamed protein product [Owenia fusiformis]
MILQLICFTNKVNSSTWWFHLIMSAFDVRFWILFLMCVTEAYLQDTISFQELYPSTSTCGCDLDRREKDKYLESLDTDIYDELRQLQSYCQNNHIKLEHLQKEKRVLANRVDVLENDINNIEDNIIDMFKTHSETPLLDLIKIESERRERLEEQIQELNRTMQILLKREQTQDTVKYIQVPRDLITSLSTDRKTNVDIDTIATLVINMSHQIDRIVEKTQRPNGSSSNAIEYPDYHP